MKSNLISSAIVMFLILPISIILPNLVPENSGIVFAQVSQEQAVTQVLSRYMAQRRSGELIVRSTRFADHYALVSWRLGEMGGQSLLEQLRNQWRVVDVWGGAIDALSLQQQFGVPQEAARALVQE